MVSRQYRERKPSPVMGICGIIVALGGIYFLVIDPGEMSTGFGEIINLHKAVVGQTLLICGTILIAVQWRPR